MKRTVKVGVYLLILGSLVGCYRPKPFQIDLIDQRESREQDAQHAPMRVEGAKSEPDEPLENLNDVLTFAALNNPEMKAAFYQWRSASERPKQAGALPDPTLGYRYYIEQVETRVGAQQQALSISQKLPWAAKLQIRKRIAQSRAEEARRRFLAAKLKLFRIVKEAYFEYIYLLQAAQVARGNLELLKNFEQVAQTRYKTAGSSHRVLVRTQVELGKVEDHLLSIENELATARARVNEILNRKPQAPLPSDDTIGLDNVEVDTANLRELAKKNNPTLFAKDMDVLAREKRVDLAKQEYYPDLTLGLTWIETNDSTGGRRPENDGTDPLIASAAINVPIWRGKDAAGVREAHWKYAVWRLQRTQMIRGIEQRVEALVQKYRDAKRRAELYDDALIPKAVESLNAVEAAFRTGKTGFVDYIDVQRNLLDFQLAMHRARADAAIARAKLEETVGKDLSEPATKPADMQEGKEPSE